MSTSSIRVHGLAKQYKIGARPRYNSLRDRISDTVAPLWGKARAIPPPVTYPYIWALDHVDFEVERSHVVAVIGKNGAGKSTLLKILSRITEPTEGYADVFGRVGSPV